MGEEPIAHGVVNQCRRGIGAHTAGIGAGVALAQALVVLRGGQRHYPLAIAEHQERNFLAFEKFFQHHASAGFADHASGQHLGCDRERLIARGGDHDSFARGETVGLHHHRRVEVRQRFLDLFRRCANCEVRRGNAVAAHEVLGKTLARFQPCGGGGGTEDAQAAPLEFVHHSGGEWNFRADDGQIGLYAIGNFEQ